MGIMHIWLLGGLALAGFFFGRFRDRWEAGRWPEAYPKAVFISSLAGLVAAGLYLIRGIAGSGGQLGIFFLFGTFMLAPILGLAVCGLLRPVVYLLALAYYAAVPQKNEGNPGRRAG